MNTVIDYTYDHKGRKTKVEIDGLQQATYSYTDYSKSGSAITYGKAMETRAVRVYFSLSSATTCLTSSSHAA